LLLLLLLLCQGVLLLLLLDQALGQQLTSFMILSVSLCFEALKARHSSIAVAPAGSQGASKQTKV
jgi:hypothetical protein